MESDPHLKRKHGINITVPLGGHGGWLNRVQCSDALFAPSFDSRKERPRVVLIERISEEQLYETDIAQLEWYRSILAEPISQHVVACVADREGPPTALP
jgi:hypothetical protein